MPNAGEHVRRRSDRGWFADTVLALCAFAAMLAPACWALLLLARHNEGSESATLALATVLCGVVVPLVGAVIGLLTGRRRTAAVLCLVCVLSGYATISTGAGTDALRVSPAPVTR